MPAALAPHRSIRSRFLADDGVVQGVGRSRATRPASPADVRLAKELGFKPRSLLKNPAIAATMEDARSRVGPRPYAKRQRRGEQRRQRSERAHEAMADLTNADPPAATPTMPADI